MRILWMAVAVIAGCDQGSTCKDAVLEAQTTLALDRNEAERMIGRCEIKPWTGKERACVRGAGDVKSLVACGDGLTDVLDVAVEMTKMSQFADEMCACRASDCVERVSNEMTAWSQERAKANLQPARMTDEETRRANAIGETLGKCMSNAMGVTPNPPPTRR
jgi:hypothetical protein